LLVIGGREKRLNFDSSEKGKRLKTRVTCMGEDVPTLISQSLTNPITNCIPEIKHSFAQLAKVYGEGNMLRYKDMMQPRDWNELVCDLDYSGHDNNTSENQIVVAFAFLRLCFREGSDIDKLFYYAMSGMIHKRMILPDSNLVYLISKGVSTGHGFTSLITTVCAYGTLATAINKVCKEKYMDKYNYYLKSTFIGNAGDDCNIRQHVDLMDDVYQEVSFNSGHTIDDMNNNGYIDSNNILSRVTFLKKQFFEFSWNPPELFKNLLHPATAERNFGHRADNLKVLMYQSPLSLYMNNLNVCLIIMYILCGRGYKFKDMIQAQLDGRTLPIERLFDICNEIGFRNPNFIDELLKIDYGSFKSGLIAIDKDIIIGSSSMFDKTWEINLSVFIKEQLVNIKKTLKRKQWWFTRNVRYQMHRQKNTLTVYDFMKVSTIAKSSNISYHGLRLYYQRLEIEMST
jgi:hypothetical protein